MIYTTFIIILIANTLLLINSIGWIPMIKRSVGRSINVLFKMGFKPKTDIGMIDKGVTSLKLEAQKINEFDGE
jgi:hypothetical protein